MTLAILGYAWGGELEGWQCSIQRKNPFFVRVLLSFHIKFWTARASVILLFHCFDLLASTLLPRNWYWNSMYSYVLEDITFLVV